MSFNPIRKTGDHKAENFNDRIFSWWRTLNCWSWHAKSSYTSRSVLYVAHHFVALLIFFCYISAHFLPHKSQLFISYFSVLQTSLFHAAADAITVPFRCCLADGTLSTSIISLKLVHCEWGVSGKSRKSERKEITIFYFIFSLLSQKEIKRREQVIKTFSCALCKAFFVD